MLAFLNDISISPDGVVTEDNLDIIKQLIHVSNELKKYGITKIRVPKNLMSESIAGSHSLEYYINHTANHDIRGLILSFIDSRLERRTTEIDEIINAEENNKAVDTYLADKNSVLLTEAYLMECPVISFQTHASFSVDFLECKYHVLNDEHQISNSPIEIENLFSIQNFTSHREFLIDWKKKIIFSKARWKPKDNPVWNTHTASLLNEISFPQSRKGNREKREELNEVGTMVAEMNGWKFDKEITRKNKNPQQLRTIFRSKNNGSTFYLSIDFENPDGRFELHNHRGKHLSEIKFADGVQTKESDNTGQHDIQV